MDLKAYRMYAGFDTPLIVSPLNRPWMEASQDKFAYRCLPVLLANQGGWLLTSPQKIRVGWTGNKGMDSLTVEKLDGEGHWPCAISNFGSGIVTFSIPYLFRTPPGWNLLVRGPANMPKDGISPLEGLVETDWSLAHFTMNWMMTRPGSVTFAIGEPVGMVLPQQRNDLEQWTPQVLDMPEDLKTRHDAFCLRRAEFNKQVLAGEDVGWQKHYFQGKTHDEERAPEHQTKRALKSF